MDILRHQSSPVQQGERNNTTVLTTTSDGRMSKALYTPILQSKDNRSKSAPPVGTRNLLHARLLPGYNSRENGTESVTVVTWSVTVT